jgi:hypothetical protein
MALLFSTTPLMPTGRAQWEVRPQMSQKPCTHNFRMHLSSQVVFHRLYYQADSTQEYSVLFIGP